jgi:hypothetical protein
MRLIEQTTMTLSRTCARVYAHPQASATRTYALALACASALLVSACEAQKPPMTALKPAPLNLSNTAPFSEPAITGKIVDAQTKQPIQGAFVYGYYATHGGGTLAGGSKPGEPVKSFLAVTDADGVYKLDAWDTGTRQIGGVRGDRFPYLGIYKPGYDLWYDRMSTIAQYRPKSGVAGTEVEIKDGVRDWTKYPHLLAPLTKEIDRYNALDNSNQIMMMIGECGWEVYAPVLLAQHNEWKGILQRSFPPGELNAAGYSKGRYNHPDLTLRANQTQQTTVDVILKRHLAQANSWSCANPMQLFKAKK